MYDNMQTKHISFNEISTIWSTHLWPNRQSKIETHSAMTWPMTHPTKPYDMTIFTYPAWFLGIYDGTSLIAVNSCHSTSLTEFRSRGLWVHESYRGCGFARQLLEETIIIAKAVGAEMIWTMPRMTSIPVYSALGFSPVYSIPVIDAEFGPNVYAVKTF